MKTFLLLAVVILLLGGCAPKAGTVVQLSKGAVGCATYVAKDDMWLDCQTVSAQKAVVADNLELGHELGGKIRLEMIGGKALWFVETDFSVVDTSPSQ